MAFECGTGRQEEGTVLMSITWLNSDAVFAEFQTGRRISINVNNIADF
jgi:hypothetical protein